MEGRTESNFGLGGGVNPEDIVGNAVKGTGIGDHPSGDTCYEIDETCSSFFPRLKAHQAQGGTI